MLQRGRLQSGLDYYFLNHSLREIIFPYFKEGKIFAQIYKFNNKKKLLPAWNDFKIIKSRPLSRKCML